MFVDGFPGSISRPTIFARWLAHRALLQSLVPVTCQWLDGGFVESKDETSDADVTSLIDGPAFDALDLTRQQAVRNLTNGPGCKPTWLCDSYGIFIYPEGHLQHNLYLAARGYWDNWWSRASISGQPKGYLEIR